MSKTLKLVIVSLDENLLSPNPQGDTLLRFQFYQKYAQPFRVFIPTSRSSNLKPSASFVTPVYGSNRLIAYLKLIFVLYRHLKSTSTNLIITNDLTLSFFVYWAKLFSRSAAKLHSNVFGFQLASIYWIKERPQNFLLAILQALGIYFSDTFRTDNQREKNILTKRFRVNPNRILVVPITPSPDSQRIFRQTKASSSLRRKFLGDKKKHLILTVANFEPAKDLPTVIKVAQQVIKEIPSAHFVIVGVSHHTNKLITYINRQNLGPHITVIGPQPYQTLPQFFASADLYLLSSTHEGFPRVLMEAALTKLPIVTTDVFGAQELIKHYHSGIICPIRNHHCLSKAIVYLLQNPTKARKYSQRAYQTSLKKLNFDKNLATLIKAYQNTVIKNQVV